MPPTTHAGASFDGAPLSLTPDAAVPPSREGMSLLTITALLLEHAAFIAKTCLVAVVLVVGIALLLPATYTTTVSFVSASPELSLGGLAQFAGLAGQLGSHLGGKSGETSPEFFVEVIKSESFLRRLAEARYRTSASDSGSTLMDLYKVDVGAEYPRRLDATIQLLATKVLSVRTDPVTGIVTTSVRTKWPRVSEELGTSLFHLLDEYNISTRQGEGTAQRAFMAARVDTARQELANAEAQMQNFLSGNRDFKNSPRLTVEYDRLQREVSFRQTVLTTVTQTYEQARLDAARNTPSILPVERPEIALRADRRNLVVKAVLALVIGFIASVLVLLARDFLERSRELEPAAFARLTRAARPFTKFLPRRGASSLS